MISSILKHSNKSFFNPINIFDSFTHSIAVFLIYFFRLTSKFIFTAMLAPSSLEEKLKLKSNVLGSPENIDIPLNCSIYEMNDGLTTMQYRVLDNYDALGGFDGTTDLKYGEGLAEAAGANLRGKSSKRRSMHRVMESTVVDISMTPLSFPPVSLSLSRSPLF